MEVGRGGPAAVSRGAEDGGLVETTSADEAREKERRISTAVRCKSLRREKQRPLDRVTWYQHML